MKWKLNHHLILYAMLAMALVGLSSCFESDAKSSGNGPSITSQPQSLTENPGTLATFNIQALNAQSYQWQKNGVAINGATDPIYTIAAVQEQDQGNYTCVVSNDVGTAKSKTAFLSVNDPPVIVTQPQNQLKYETDSITLTVEATGTEPIYYQWQKNGVDIPCSFSSYVISSAVLTDAAAYQCVVSNPAGSTTSASATLQVVSLFFAPAPTKIATIPARSSNYGAEVFVVANPGSDEVCFYDGTGRITRRFSPIQLPTCVAVKANGEILVGNALHQRIDVYTNDGTWLRSFGKIAVPSDIKIAAGAIWVTASVDNVVKVYNLASEAFVKEIGVGYLYQPVGIAVNEITGMVIVCNRDPIYDIVTKILPTVTVLDINGTFQKFIYKADNLPTGTPGMAPPQGVTLDAAGNIYVVDAAWGGVFVFDATGLYQKVIGHYGQDKGGLRTPLDAAFLADGRLLVTNSRNCRIESFNRGEGEVTRFDLDSDEMPSNITTASIQRHLAQSRAGIHYLNDTIQCTNCHKMKGFKMWGPAGLNNAAQTENLCNYCHSGTAPTPPLCTVCHKTPPTQPEPATNHPKWNWKPVQHVHSNWSQKYPAGGTNPKFYVTCVRCHIPHRSDVGTNAKLIRGGDALYKLDVDTLDDTATTPNPNPTALVSYNGNDTDLLRTSFDTAGNGICEVCHDSTKGMTHHTKNGTKYSDHYERWWNPADGSVATTGSALPGTCLVCHPHSQTSTAATPNPLGFIYPNSDTVNGTGTKQHCKDCHSTERINTTGTAVRRRPITQAGGLPGEFAIDYPNAKNGSHLVSDPSKLTNRVCLVCHELSEHRTIGTVVLRDPDNNANTAIRFARFGQFGDLARNNANPLIVTQDYVMTKFCLVCHSSNGASDPNVYNIAYLKSESATANKNLKPFKTAQVVDVFSQFDPATSTTYHPVLGYNPTSMMVIKPLKGELCLQQNVDTNHNYPKMLSPVSGSKITLNCWDCHAYNSADQAATTRYYMSAHGGRQKFTTATTTEPTADIKSTSFMLIKESMSYSAPTAKIFRGVWGSSATNVFAVGDGGVIIRYDGTKWTDMTSPTTQNLRSVWGTSATDVFAVGAGGTIIHYDGNAWTAMTSGTTNQLNGVWGSAWNNVYAVGNTATIRYYNGITWAASTPPGGVTANLNGIWGSANNNIFAVGALNTNAVIIRYTGASWTNMTGATTGTQILYGVWGWVNGGTTYVLAVGANGTIRNYNGTVWAASTSGAGTTQLNGIWGWGSGTTATAYAVGNAGMIRYLNNAVVTAAWSNPPVASPTAQALYRVWGTASNNVIVVGAATTLQHYNGSAWSAGAYNPPWGPVYNATFGTNQNTFCGVCHPATVYNSGSNGGNSRFDRHPSQYGSHSNTYGCRGCHALWINYNYTNVTTQKARIHGYRSFDTTSPAPNVFFPTWGGQAATVSKHFLIGGYIGKWKRGTSDTTSATCWGGTCDHDASNGTDTGQAYTPRTW